MADDEYALDIMRCVIRYYSEGVEFFPSLSDDYTITKDDFDVEGFECRNEGGHLKYRSLGSTEITKFVGPIFRPRPVLYSQPVTVISSREYVGDIYRYHLRIRYVIPDALVWEKFIDDCFLHEVHLKSKFSEFLSLKARFEVVTYRYYDGLTNVPSIQGRFTKSAR